jgi:transposase
LPTDNEFTKVLGWPGYRVYRHHIDEKAKRLKLWVRRKRGNRILRCPSCGRRVQDIHEVYEREVRDLPCFEFQTTVIIELYRIRCPDCGVKAEKVAALPSKAPYSKRFEDAVGQACESAAARQVARRVGLAESTVRAIDLRYLERWEARRRQPPLRQMGVDEIYRGKSDKFLTVVCNLETSEPLWFGKERKKETLDDFFRSQLVSRQRKRIEAACVDMWEPFRKSLEQWAPQCKIVYDKYEGAMLNYLQKWMDQLKWQRLEPFEDLAAMLLKHVDGIVNYCRTKVRFGVVEAVNGNIRMLINRGRGYKNLRYLLLKAKRLAVTNMEFIAVCSVKKAA